MIRIPALFAGKPTGADVMDAPSDGETVTAEPATPLPPDAELPALGANLRRMRQIGLVVFAIQLIGFGVWSTIVWERLALTWDFSLLYGAASQISHSGFNSALHIVEAHFDAVILWPLAWLIRLPGHGLLLLWTQDLAVVGAELVGFFWLCEILERRFGEDQSRIRWLAALSLLLLVGDPWILLTPAFDFHLEAFGALFIILAARALQRGHIRASLLWVVATLACGFVAASYVGALAISALIAGKKRQRLAAIGLLVAGALGLVAMTQLGQGAAFLSQNYGYLAGSGKTPSSVLGLVYGAATHPSIAVHALWSQRRRIVASLLPAGLLGAFWGWASGIAIVIVLANSLQVAAGLKVPSFQWLPLYLFVAIGTVLFLAKLNRNGVTRLARGSVLALMVFLAVDTAAWAGAWMPKLPSIWLHVSPAAGRVLRQVEGKIPANAPVYVAQGVVGNYPSHPFFEVLINPSPIAVPRGSRQVWVVLTPNVGIETLVPATQEAMITKLVDTGHAKVVAYGAGVWGLLWSPPNTNTILSFPGQGSPIGGWVVAGKAGRADLSGPRSEWSAVSNGRRGYVVSGDDFQRGLGTYEATVTLSSSGPAVVEAWDSTGNSLLNRFTVTQTRGRSVVSFPVTVDHIHPDTAVYGGWGPFSFRPAYIPPGNSIELRVWQPGSSRVRVYSLSLSCPAGTSCPMSL